MNQTVLRLTSRSQANPRTQNLRPALIAPLMLGLGLIASQPLLAETPARAAMPVALQGASQDASHDAIQAPGPPVGPSGPYATAQPPYPATALPPSPYAVAEGTTFLIRLDDRLDTRKLSPGKRFKGTLEEDLLAPNGATIRRGKRVYGHVSSIDRGLHARLLLSFESIDTDHGKVPLIATVTGVPGEHSVKTPDAEGDIQKKGVSTRREIEDVAVGAAIGALGGSAAGGGRGAGIGAGAGAGLGAVAGILADRDLRLEKGTALEVRLDRDLEIPSR